jgi:hypothetical protein
MAFIREIPPEEATGPVREAYDADMKTLGYANIDENVRRALVVGRAFEATP